MSGKKASCEKLLLKFTRRSKKHCTDFISKNLKITLCSDFGDTSCNEFCCKLLLHHVLVHDYKQFETQYSYNVHSILHQVM